MTDLLETCGTCGGPLDGRACRNCETERYIEEAQQRRFAEYAIRVLGGVRAWTDFTLESFKESEHNRDALMAARSFDARKDNLYLFGPVGSGKSHLATAIARRFLEKRVPVWVLKLQQFSLDVRAAHGPGRAGEVEKELLTQYIEAGVLVIDDLGVEKGTEFVMGLLYRVVDGRYMNKPGGLIVTSNLSPQDLAGKLGDDRITSRLAQMCRFFSFVGEKDYRMESHNSDAKCKEKK